MAGKTEIGKLAVVLTAEANQFESTMAKAQGRIRQFEKDNSKGGIASFGGSGGIFSKILGGAEGEGLFGGISGAAMKAGIAGAAFGALIGTFKKFGDIAINFGAHADEIHDAADALGATAAGLAALKKLAGGQSESEALDFGLAKLSRDIGAAIEGSEEAEKVFKRLGLSGRELAAEPLEDAFRDVARAINALPTAVQRAGAEFDVFGKKGQKLADLITKVEKLEAMTKDSIMRGAIPDKDLAESYDTYERAKKDVGESLEGLGNRAKQVFAKPLLDTLTFWANTNAGMLDMAFGPAVSEEQAAQMMEDARRKKAHDAEMARIALEQKLKQQVIDDAQKGAEAMVTALQDQWNTLKLGSAEWAKIARFEHDGAKMETLSKAVKLMREVADLGKAQNIFEGTRSPLEKFRKEVAELEDLRQRSFLTDDNAARAKLAALEALESANGPVERITLSPLERGSQADRSFGLQQDFEQSQANRTIQERLADALKRGEAKDQRRNEMLQELIGLQRDQKPIGVLAIN